jgi:hypothetical protein
MKNQPCFPCYALAVAVIAIVATICLIALDFNDPAPSTAPNGEPIGAQHPRSGQ